MRGLNILENHPDAIALKDIFSRPRTNLKIGESGWRRIPSISSFSIVTNQWNHILEDLGLKRKLPPTFEFKAGESKRMNRYMQHQIQRMTKARDCGNNKKYWALAIGNLKNSVAFRVSAFNTVFPGWHRDMPVKYVFKILRKVEKIYKKNISDLEYKRVYIPKPNGKWRPLGVPRHAWRVVLHGHANFLSLFYANKISKQHAYLPNRGCLTAWKDLLSKINKYKYIYEIDLKNCFNEINSAALSWKLEESGVPWEYAMYLQRINETIPKFPDKEELDESVLKDRKEIQKAISRKVPVNSWSITDMYNSLDPTEQKLIHGYATHKNQSVGTVIAEIARRIQEIGPYINGPEWEEMELWAYFTEFFGAYIGNSFLNGEIPKSWYGNSNRGLPQGSAISPILTVFLLQRFTHQCEDSVFYADDGLFFSNTPFDIKDDPELGIFLSKEKSGWLKWDGKWLKPLIFLGIKWENGILSGHTRKGSRLEIKDDIQNIMEWLKNLNPEYNSFNYLFNKTSLGGNIMQKMYNNSWTDSFYEWHVSLTGIKNSWLSLRPDNFKTHTSEACAFLAGILRGERRTLWSHNRLPEVNSLPHLAVALEPPKPEAKNNRRKYAIWSYYKKKKHQR